MPGTKRHGLVDDSLEETTGATSDELKAADHTSTVKSSYTKRGTLRNVDSSYGMLVSNIKRSGDGLVQSMTLGDAATTTTAMRYDTRRRLSSVQTFRGSATWASEPPATTPAAAAGDGTHQLLLQDLDYSYDVVGNPTEIRDWRTADEWPDTAKPVTRRMEYDDLYRVTRLDYEYPGGFDKSASPFANEIAGAYSDPRRPIPPGQRLLSKRPLWQSYKYDWLGNTTRTDDDQHAFWDRSLGDVTNNDSSGLHPYRFMAAVQPGTSSQHSGSLTIANTSYDAAGNLLGLQLARSTADCAPGLAVCNSRFFYTWDEVGRLANATRTEGSGPSSTGPIVDYLYDANDERVVKQHFARVGNSNTFTPTSTTLYVFDSLEIRRAPFNAVTKQYTVDSTTEVAYLSAHGMRLARLDYEQPPKGEPKLASTPNQLHDPKLHILLELPDHLGSENLTIDHASGELVEARTYQPYGATESDYRPDRWKGSREDYGFTGKEEDIEVGLQYFGKRYLSPYLARWVSADPLAVHSPGSGDLNLYAYVSGRALLAVDPLGLEVSGKGGSLKDVHEASPGCCDDKLADPFESGQYFGKRYLSPYLGRWISPDPLAVHAGKADLNLYAYVTGRLLKNIDPVGLEEDESQQCSFEANQTDNKTGQASNDAGNVETPGPTVAKASADATDGYVATAKLAANSRTDAMSAPRASSKPALPKVPQFQLTEPSGGIGGFGGASGVAPNEGVGGATPNLPKGEIPYIDKGQGVTPDPVDATRGRVASLGLAAGFNAGNKYAVGSAIVADTPTGADVGVGVYFAPSSLSFGVYLKEGTRYALGSSASYGIEGGMTESMNDFKGNATSAYAETELHGSASFYTNRKSVSYSPPIPVVGETFGGSGGIETSYTLPMDFGVLLKAAGNM